MTTAKSSKAFLAALLAAQLLLPAAVFAYEEDEVAAEPVPAVEAERDAASGQATGKREMAPPPRDAASGLPTGKRMMAPEVKSPRDAASGQASGKRMMGGFCDRLTALAAQMETRFSDRKVKLEERRTEQKGAIAERREDRQDKKADLRTKAAEHRDDAIERLEKRAATNTAIVAAVAQFKREMEAAVTARRTAVDAAQAKFRAELDALIAKRKQKADYMVVELKTMQVSSFNKAKADCAAGVDEETIKANLKAALDAGQKAFMEARKALEPQGQEVKTLADMRQQAVQAAFDAFKAAAEAARAKLKAALDAARG